MSTKKAKKKAKSQKAVKESKKQQQGTDEQSHKRKFGKEDEPNKESERSDEEQSTDLSDSEASADGSEEKENKDAKGEDSVRATEEKNDEDISIVNEEDEADDGEDARSTILGAFGSTAGTSGVLDPISSSQAAGDSNKLTMKVIAAIVCAAIVLGIVAFFLVQHQQSVRAEAERHAQERFQEQAMKEASSVVALYMLLDELVLEHQELIASIMLKQQENANALEAWENSWNKSLEEYDAAVVDFERRIQAVWDHNERERQREADSRTPVTNDWGWRVGWEYTYTPRFRDEPTNFPDLAPMPTAVTVNFDDQIGRVATLSERLTIISMQLEDHDARTFVDEPQLMMSITDLIRESLADISSTLNDPGLISQARFVYDGGGSEAMGQEINSAKVSSLVSVAPLELAERLFDEMIAALELHSISAEDAGMPIMEEEEVDEADEQDAPAA